MRRRRWRWRRWYPIALAAVLFFIGDGAASKRLTWWQRSAYAAAPKSPTEYGVQWAHLYNAAAAIRKDPVRITWIGCKVAGPRTGPYFVCGVSARNVKDGRRYCLNVALGDAFQVLEARKIKCPPAQPTA